MKMYTLIFLIILSFIICDDENIIEINHENTQFFNTTKYSIVYFYNKKISEHKKIIKEFNKAAHLSLEHKLPYKFFKVDTQKYEKIKESINPPAIKIYTDKKTRLYDAPYDAKKILRYLNKELNGIIFKANSIEEIDKFKNEYELSFLLVSTLDENDSDYEILENFTLKTDSFSDTVNCVSSECIDEYGKNTITLIKNYDEKKVKLEGKITLKSLHDLIKRYSLEIAGQINKFSFSIITYYNLTSLIYFRDENNKDQIEKDKILKEIGKENPSLKFFKTDIKGNEFNKELSEFFLLNENELPTIQIFDPSKYYNYVIQTKEITKESIEQFIKEFKEGKLERELNSDAVPEQDVYSFNTIVGKTFKKIVLQSKKPYLVIFINNNKKICPECIKAAQIFHKVSDKYMRDLKDERFGMGAIDLIYNEVNREIKEIPLISFYNVPGNNQPIDFKGDFNKRELEEFIAQTLGWSEIPKDVVKEYEKEDL